MANIIGDSMAARPSDVIVAVSGISAGLAAKELTQLRAGNL
ncbi:hypothetical protein [Spirosoma agri]|nr:hypothetical protein [Spirosoma agri]